MCGWGFKLTYQTSVVKAQTAISQIQNDQVPLWVCTPMGDHLHPSKEALPPTLYSGKVKSNSISIGNCVGAGRDCVIVVNLWCISLFLTNRKVALNLHSLNYGH